ncbi:hypothetical protein QAD02_017014 [Eretmocerus hayati]|uniref:Uncharacterized protein n=1 Tax=Eretmocerus hayati TaxID=131215 RepID=A0ACC2PCQ7_9HYME|nr:hypothetical protein QAD02_017014 [Eretmocerus hayati]
MNLSNDKREHKHVRKRATATRLGKKEDMIRISFRSVAGVCCLNLLLGLLQPQTDRLVFFFTYPIVSIERKEGVCMRFEVEKAQWVSPSGSKKPKHQQQQFPVEKSITGITGGSNLLKQKKQQQNLSLSVNELLFQAACIECGKMSAIPQGAFAALHVRKNMGQDFDGSESTNKKESRNCGFSPLQEGRELTPLKYNSKLMNSIWGLYNRYSVHNFKKIDANDIGLVQAWGESREGRAAAVGVTVGPVPH